MPRPSFLSDLRPWLGQFVYGRNDTRRRTTRLQVNGLEDRINQSVSVAVAPTQQNGYVAEAITFTRTGDLSAAAVVTFAVAGDSVHHTATIPAGAADVTITYVPVVDSNVVTDNQFAVTVVGDGGNTATATVPSGNLDDPPPSPSGVVTVVIERGPDGEIVGFSYNQVGGDPNNNLLLDLDNLNPATGPVTAETLFLSADTLNLLETEAANVRADQAPRLRALLYPTDPNQLPNWLQFSAVVRGLEAPLTKDELDVILGVLSGTPIRGLDAPTAQTVRTACLNALLQHLQNAIDSGSGMDRNNAATLLAILRGDYDYLFTGRNQDRLQDIKTAAWQLLQNTYGVYYWDGGTSAPNAAATTVASLNQFAGDLGAPDYQTRENAEQAITNQLLGYIQNRDYDSFAAAVERLRELTQSADPETRRRAAAILAKPGISMYYQMYLYNTYCL